MNMFVHNALRHYLKGPLDNEGDDLGGGEAEQEEQEEQEEEADGDEQDADDDEIVLVIDGKAAESEEEEVEGQPAPGWVKELRKTNREDKRRIRELEEQVRQRDQSQQQSKPPVVLGKKPSMEDDDIDYDGEKFEVALTAWHDRKREIESAEREQEQAATKQKTEWEGKLAGYQTAKAALKFKDFEDAEDVARNTLDVTQQGILIQGATNSALVVYALGKNPKKAAELAAIKDPIKFAWAAAQLEAKLTTTKAKKAPPPADREVKGQGRITGTTDTKLEQLREKAAKTGDMSEVHAYKRAMKRKAK